MSHRRAVLLALAGAAAGTWAGLGYLGDDGRCDGIAQSVAACRFSHAWLPFIGAIVVGVLAAFALAALWPRLVALVIGDDGEGPAGRLKMGKEPPHGLEDELRDVALRADELGLERSGEPPEGSGERSPGPARIGERGRPVPRPRRS